MKPHQIMNTLSLLPLVASCGGIGENATVPLAEPASATFVDVGNHVVHFSAQLTNQLPLEVAREHNIVRSKNRTLINISVIKKSTNRPVTADIKIKTVNLTGQRKNVRMRVLREQEAIYYIGETSVANQETLIFEIDVRPQGVEETSHVRFKSQFYTD